MSEHASAQESGKSRLAPVSERLMIRIRDNAYSPGTIAVRDCLLSEVTDDLDLLTYRGGVGEHFVVEDGV